MVGHGLFGEEPDRGMLNQCAVQHSWATFCISSWLGERGLQQAPCRAAKTVLVDTQQRVHQFLPQASNFSRQYAEASICIPSWQFPVELEEKCHRHAISPVQHAKRKARKQEKKNEKRRITRRSISQSFQPGDVVVDSDDTAEPGEEEAADDEHIAADAAPVQPLTMAALSEAEQQQQDVAALRQFCSMLEASGDLVRALVFKIQEALAVAQPLLEHARALGEARNASSIAVGVGKKKSRRGSHFTRAARQARADALRVDGAGVEIAGSRQFSSQQFNGELSGPRGSSSHVPAYQTSGLGLRSSVEYPSA